MVEFEQENVSWKIRKNFTTFYYIIISDFLRSVLPINAKCNNYHQICEVDSIIERAMFFYIKS